MHLMGNILRCGFWCCEHGSCRMVHAVDSKQAAGPMFIIIKEQHTLFLANSGAPWHRGTRCVRLGLVVGFIVHYWLFVDN